MRQSTDRDLSSIQQRATPTATDRLRSVVVAVLALAQVAASPLTTAVLGPSSNNALISDANKSLITPAGYAFAIWGLIYLWSLALAGWQLLPSQSVRTVHRRSGWWLAAAFGCSTVWVPIFGARLLWLAQLVIFALVGLLSIAAIRLRENAPGSPVERLLLRLPVMLYFGWAALASTAGLATTLRSLGMPEYAGWVVVLSTALLVVAAAGCVVVVGRLTANLGFVFTVCWALIAIAVETPAGAVKVTALGAGVVVLAVLIVRTIRSHEPSTILLG